MAAPTRTAAIQAKRSRLSDDASRLYWSRSPPHGQITYKHNGGKTEQPRPNLDGPQSRLLGHFDRSVKRKNGIGHCKHGRRATGRIQQLAVAADLGAQPICPQSGRLQGRVATRCDLAHRKLCRLSVVLLYHNMNVGRVNKIPGAVLRIERNVKPPVGRLGGEPRGRRRHAAHRLAPRVAPKSGRSRASSTTARPSGSARPK